MGPRLSYQLKIAKKKLMGDATTTAPPQSCLEGSVQMLPSSSLRLPCVSAIDCRVSVLRGQTLLPITSLRPAANSRRHNGGGGGGPAANATIGKARGADISPSDANLTEAFGFGLADDEGALVVHPGSSRLPVSFSITPRFWRALRRAWQPVRR